MRGKEELRNDYLRLLLLNYAEIRNHSNGDTSITIQSEGLTNKAFSFGAEVGNKVENVTRQKDFRGR